VYRKDPRTHICARCGNLLELVKRRHLDYTSLVSGGQHLSVWRYAKALPAGEKSNRVTLGEGGTPLARSVSFGKALKLKNLYFKNEGQNPTGSFKDRGMTVAVTRAIECGARVLVCASTGNTSASLAAYAARAGLPSAVLLPEGKVAPGKLLQAVAHGSRILKVKGDFDWALEIVREIVEENDSVYLVNSINPYRVEGQKTLAYEIYEQLEMSVPDYVVLPVGNAGNISALWKGFKELHDWGISDRLPAMVGVQAKGAAPIADALARGFRSIERWPRPSTVATAIRIGNPVSWKKAVAAIEESHGEAITVSDAEMIRARNELASKEGIFVELASAAPVAALGHLRREIGSESVVVCVATGNGLKEPESLGVDLSGAPVVKDSRTFQNAFRRLTAPAS